MITRKRSASSSPLRLAAAASWPVSGRWRSSWLLEVPLNRSFPLIARSNTFPPHPVAAMGRIAACRDIPAIAAGGRPPRARAAPLPVARGTPAVSLPVANSSVIPTAVTRAPIAAARLLPRMVSQIAVPVAISAPIPLRETGAVEAITATNARSRCPPAGAVHARGITMTVRALRLGSTAVIGVTSMALVIVLWRVVPAQMAVFVALGGLAAVAGFNSVWSP